MVAWVVGNWKQNPATIDEVNQLVDTLTMIDENTLANCQVMIAPSYVHILHVSGALKQSKHILISAQDVSIEEKVGAFTGDCSALQLKNVGASWSIIGHSERRQYHHENHEILLKKMLHCFHQHLGIILCIGETVDEQQNHQTLEVLTQQLSVIDDVIFHIKDDVKLRKYFLEKIMIAYEPVWAIGTGKVPTLAEIHDIHQHIKSEFTNILSKYQVSMDNDVRVLYGGSVNAQNAKTFANSPLIDGALVGGASLNAKEFLHIIEEFNQSN